MAIAKTTLKCAAVWFLSCMLLAACENDIEEVDVLTKESKDIEVATNIEAIMSQTATLKAILKAPLMYRVKGDTVYAEFPESIFVTFYSDSVTKQSVVKAKYAKYFELMNKVYLRDSVVVYNFTGDTLYSDDLWWDQAQEIFYSDKPVRVRQTGQWWNGTGIRAKTDFSKQTIYDAVGEVETNGVF